jgi:ABC-type transport system involved in multi-copper enzyme maturation permease subunit
VGIREKGYYGWDGELTGSGISWLPILKRGIRNAFKKKHAKALFGFAALPFISFLGAVYISTKPELKMLSRLVSLLRDDSVFFNAFYTNGLLIFIMLLLCVFIGAELISGDLKFNSLPLYFSRPLDKTDYLFGKYSILFFYLLAFSLLPGVLLVIFKIIFTGQFAFSFWLLLAIFLYPVIVAFFFASLTLMVSSLSSNRKFVWISIFLIYIFSDGLGEMLRSIFKDPALMLFSIETNIEQTGCFLFQTKAGINAPPWISFLIIVTLSLTMFLVLYKRIGRSEV